MTTQDSFVQVRNGLFAGDADAAAAIFAHFAQRLTALARTRLSKRIQSKVDPEDVTQSAFRSFFLGCTEGRFDIKDSHGLWSLLVLITLRKCCRQADLFGAAMRHTGREISLAGSGDSAQVAVPLVSKEPSPEESVQLAEMMEQVAQRLSTPLKRQIFEMTLQGYSVPEISEALDYYERGIERVRAEARSILSEIFTS